MSSSGAQLHNVFVYGSFQEPEVISVMLDRIPEIVSATLTGLGLGLKDVCIHVLCPSKTDEVHGKVLMGLTDEELKNLDAVEGNEYERVTVGVVKKDNSEKMQVKTYIIE